MDSSALIFVFLALFWAGYVLPRALKRHDEAQLDSAVDSFSDTVRVLERTPSVMEHLSTPPRSEADEPRRSWLRVPRRAQRPAAEADRSASEAVDEAAIAVPDEGPQADRVPSSRPVATVTRASARAAAARRRRVLLVLVGLTVLSIVLATTSVIGWSWTAFAAAVVIGWLVLCRLMVRRTSTVGVARATESGAEAPGPVRASETEAVVESAHEADEAADDDDALWDPLPMTLPTYVTKPSARRTVRTIDLAGTTSSGHDAHDSRLAQQAREAEARAARPPAPGRKSASA